MIVAVSITKSFQWRGKTEQFSNVYHYDTGGIAMTDSGWDALIDALVTIEKACHHTSVTFVQGRIWGPTDGPASASVTRRIKDVSGNGTMGGSLGLWKECTVVGSFYIGRSAVKNVKRFLRKYYHGGALASSGTTQVLSGESPLATADKTPYVTAMNAAKTILIGGNNNDLCTPQGDHLPAGSSPTILDYPHVRQLKQ